MGLTTGAWLKRTGRALKVFFGVPFSTSFLRRSSRCSFNLRETASPGSSKVDRVNGFEDLVGWKGACWRELTRAWVVARALAVPRMGEGLELAVVLRDDILEISVHAVGFLVVGCAERVAKVCLGFELFSLRIALASLFREVANFESAEGFGPSECVGLPGVLSATLLWVVSSVAG